MALRYCQHPLPLPLRLKEPPCPPLSIPAHKNTTNPAAQVEAPLRFQHPKLGPLVAVRTDSGMCTENKGWGRTCACFHSNDCPDSWYGGPPCAGLIWVNDPAHT